MALKLPSICGKCGKRPRRQAGGYCKPCNAEWARERLQRATIEEREQRRIAKLRWRHANPERNRAHARETYNRNPDRQHSYGYGWRKRNRDRVAIYEQNRRAPGRLTIVEWKAIVKQQSYRCAICNRRAKLTRDHIIPVTRGGTNDAANIQGLCASCNARKGNRIAA